MLCARETFHADGGRVVVKGELVPEDSDLVAGRESLFAFADCPTCAGNADAAAALADAQAALKAVTAERDALAAAAAKTKPAAKAGS